MIDMHENSTPRQRARVWATVLALSLCLGWASSAIAEPTMSTLGSASGEIYASPSIAEDAMGAAHVAWKSGSNQITVQTIAPNREVTTHSTYTSPAAIGDRLGIAIDGNGVPHLFFQGDGALYLASYQDNTWNTSTLWTSPNNRTLAADPVIARAPNGTVYTTFVIVDNVTPANRTHTLYYGAVGSTPGSILTTAAPTEEWDNPSLIITDSAAHIAITRRDAATFTDAIYYGNNSAGEWQFTALEGAQAPDDQTPIAINDASGEPYIAYHDLDQGLHILSYNGAEWTNTPVDVARPGSGISLAHELSTSIVTHTYEDEGTSYLHLSQNAGREGDSYQNIVIGNGVVDETATAITDRRLHVSVYQRWDEGNTHLSAHIDTTNNAPALRQEGPLEFTLQQNQEDFSFTLEAQDQDGDRLSWSVTQPRTGTAGLTMRDGYSNTVSYVPNEGFEGEDFIEVTVSDDYGGSATITVNFTVEASAPAPPVIEPASADQTMEEDGDPLSVMWDAMDPNGTPVSFSILQMPANGMVFLASERGVATTSYTPNANFYGTDSYTVRVTDGDGATTDAVVNINVTSVNDAPVLSEERAIVIMSEDNAPNAFALSVEATDVDDENLTWTISQQEPTAPPRSPTAPSATPPTPTTTAQTASRQKSPTMREPLQPSGSSSPSNPSTTFPSRSLSTTPPSPKPHGRHHDRHAQRGGCRRGTRSPGRWPKAKETPTTVTSLWMERRS